MWRQLQGLTKLATAAPARLGTGGESKQRQEAAQFYGGAAMKRLREAVSKGCKDVANMKKDTDLDALREPEDFKKLLAELEAKKTDPK